MNIYEKFLLLNGLNCFHGWKKGGTSADVGGITKPNNKLIPAITIFDWSFSISKRERMFVRSIMRRRIILHLALVNGT
jgi:hypothetical protein